jgi:hypothetical protein
VNSRPIRDETLEPGHPRRDGLTRYKFRNYVKEDHHRQRHQGRDDLRHAHRRLGVPVLTNDQIASARDVVTRSRFALAASARHRDPGHAGWFEEINRVMTDLKPDSIKGYTIGDPIYQTKKKTNWRMDDEKARLSTVRSHAQERHQHHLHPQGPDAGRLHDLVGDMWQYATVWDVGKAPKTGRRSTSSSTTRDAAVPRAAGPRLAQFEKTGRFDWVSDLADIPAKFGVKNVYGELGACFANTCVTHPKLAAALMGTLIKGLGEDKVIWGTDSGMVGLAAMADRSHAPARDPEDMQKKYGYRPLGAADGPVKTGSSRATRRSSTGSMRPRRRRCRPTTSTPSRPSTSPGRAAQQSALWLLRADGATAG